MAERNVTRAAQHNGLSQSAMSKALSRLRHLLDDRLFELRDGRMEPPPRALELAGPIHGALSDISRTLKLPKAFEPREATGAVRTATIDLHQSTLLPALVARLRREAPGLDLHFQAIERHRLHDQACDRRTRPSHRANSRRGVGLTGGALVARSPRHAHRREQSAAAADDAQLVRGGRSCGRRRTCPGRRERQRGQSRRCDPGRAGPDPPHCGRTAEFRWAPVRGGKDRSDRHFAQPNLEGSCRHHGPEGGPSAFAAGRSQPPYALASAHAKRRVARMDPCDDNGNRSRAVSNRPREAPGRATSASFVVMKRPPIGGGAALGRVMKADDVKTTVTPSLAFDAVCERSENGRAG